MHPSAGTAAQSPAATAKRRHDRAAKQPPVPTTVVTTNPWRG
ncbi:hypothetical protein BZL29_7855 [Mycobacterium kansasii]|uniref:Uncharacterized protein n=1 Tax=Mycobacterium kansasii TaxID=1768 RepID=A0A1V3WG02_MYCKA|nr:hypothetical protein BZL29_7855 [Mycobacterium kansasii]